MPDPRLRTAGVNPVAVLRGGGRFSEKSGRIDALVGSSTSPWDAARVGVRGEKLCVCEGDCGGIPGDGGAMRPSALRDDARRKPGTKPNIMRNSDERPRAGRARCAEVWKEPAEGAPTPSMEPVGMRERYWRGRGRVGGLTGCGKSIVVRAQAQKEE
jgi:hypothetical protein